MRLNQALLVASCLLMLAACATVADGDRQVIAVETESAGQKITGAQCVLTNEHGASRVTSPGNVLVRYGYDDLKIQCKKQGFEPKEKVVKSDVKPKVLGNILFGGAIGFGLDHISGSAYQYPSTVSIDMGEATAATSAKSETVGSSVGAAFLAMQGTTSRDEVRTAELVRRTSCIPVKGPVLMGQESGASQFVTYCQDGRVARTICRSSECRFRTLDD